MEQSQRYDSLIGRQRDIFGRVSFLPPVVPKDGADGAVSRRKSPPKTRREQVFQAQRDHRKRTKDYMDALEEEVRRLRAEKDSLNEVAANWQRTTLALLDANDSSSRPSFQLGPGVFVWMVSDMSQDLSSELSLQMPESPQQNQLFNDAYINHLLPPELHGHVAPILLQNFCENIIPTLNLAETYRRGYINYFLPLALSCQMVLSSVLAASASHIHLTHLQFRKVAVYRFKYRSITFTKLQQASTQPDAGTMLPLLALFAILGLLIDDMIAGTGEFPGLLHMAQFWMRMDQHQHHGPREKTILRFLSNQIQMYVLHLLQLPKELWYIGINSCYSQNENTRLPHVQNRSIALPIPKPQECIFNCH